MRSKPKYESRFGWENIGSVQLPFARHRPTLKAVLTPTDTILITGATGFVGSHVVEAIAGRARVRALVRPSSRREHLISHGIELVPAALEDVESVHRAVASADVVIHLAAATRAVHESAFARANAQGTQVIVDAVLAAERAPRRLVYLSSLAAVGPARNGRPVGPHDTPAPLTAYGRTKLAGEQISQQAAAVSQVVVLRAPAVYGPRERDIYDFFRMAQLGILIVPSGPPRRLQMIHVADLARAVVLAATGDDVRGVYHIAEPRAYVWADVARLVAKAVGRKARLVTVPAGLIAAAGAVSEGLGRLMGRPSIFSRDKARELLAPGWLCETEAARRDLGFEAAIPLERGLAETAVWYREHGWL
jgi:dihydroflavonol-4-reductase